jgi:thiol:disulfide interchange protein DsbD
MAIVKDITRYLLAIVFTITFLSSQAIADQGVSFGEEQPVEKPAEIVSVSSAWSHDHARPGDDLVLAIIVDIKEGHHINADADQIIALDGFTSYPTTIRVSGVDEGVTIGELRVPEAHPVNVQFAAGELMVFDGRSVFYLPLSFGHVVEPGIFNIDIELSYQACDATMCFFPEKTMVHASIPIVHYDAAVKAINHDIFSGFEIAASSGSSGPVGFDFFGWTFSVDTDVGAGFLFLLATAAFGGMLLNFTPCVLPLVPIKIISLSNAAAQDRRRSIMLGLSMFVGVLAFWLFIGVMIAMVSSFTATNQLFQYPAFTITIGAIIAIMALGMCGMFHTGLPHFIYGMNPDQESLAGSFGLGILTAILSTPCTAPFMGAAAAWAATRHPVTTLLTFASIGVGMALPYLVFSAWPQMVRKLPRTGPGSILLKQEMGILMLAAAAYFMGTGFSAIHVQPPDPPGRLYWWAVVSFPAGAGCWLIYQVARITSRKRYRILFTVVGLVMIAGSVFTGLRLTDRGPVDWIHFTPQRFEEAVSQEKTVVMVFTAEWCLNCKALEQTVLYNDQVASYLSFEKVVPMKVDITGNNAPGKAKLKELGRVTIPLLVVFSPRGEVVFKSDFYTVDQVLGTIETAGLGALEK